MLVLRTNGTEAYYRTKVTLATANKMEAAGHFTGYNVQFGYVEGDYPHSHFEFKGNSYKLEYFSGCFCPFLLRLQK
jgi:hypothetical protein